MTENPNFYTAGYHNVTPYLSSHDAAGLMKFIQDVFDARENFVLPGENGRIMHAEVILGDSFIMLADATAEYGPTRSQLMVYVRDCDTVYQKALDAGAAAVRPPRDELYGDRSATIEDPFGNRWDISTHFEDVSPEEFQRRMAAIGA